MLNAFVDFLWWHIHINSLLNASKTDYREWFQQLEQNENFLYFVQALREVLEEVLADNDDDDDDDDSNTHGTAANVKEEGAAENSERRGGAARQRLAAFCVAPSEATLKAAVARHEQVPSRGLVADAHLFRAAGALGNGGGGGWGEDDDEDGE